MDKQMQESGFARFYLWMTEAKTTMALFFVYIVFMYLLLGLISEGPAVTLDLFTAIEMVFASFFIGLAQRVILPEEKLTRARGFLWVSVGFVITLAFCFGFGWFARFPLWCLIVFLLLTAAGMGLMVYRNYLKLRRDTKRLNRQLEQFRQAKK